MSSTSFLKLGCAALFAWAAGGGVARAITADELRQRLERGERITVIDLRATSVYQQGHIPGAINIPASLLPMKPLPPLGTVIAYDDGLGRDAIEPAIVELNKKTGVRAEALEGGFAAWESVSTLTTRPRGMQPETQARITYEQLKNTQSDDVVLVDLRTEPRMSRQSDTGTNTPPTRPLTDLRQAFPKARGVSRSPFDLPQTRQSGNAQGGKPPLLVLVDNGDGASAGAMARALKANGIKRVVILAGGEEILARGGRAGLQRAGGSLGNQPVEVNQSGVNR